MFACIQPATKVVSHSIEPKLGVRMQKHHRDNDSYHDGPYQIQEIRIRDYSKRIKSEKETNCRRVHILCYNALRCFSGCYINTGGIANVIGIGIMSGGFGFCGIITITISDSS